MGERSTGRKVGSRASRNGPVGKHTAHPRGHSGERPGLTPDFVVLLLCYPLAELQRKEGVLELMDIANVVPGVGSRQRGAGHRVQGEPRECNTPADAIAMHLLRMLLL